MNAKENLLRLNEHEINWDPHNLQCDKCLDDKRGKPSAGSYGSSLAHFEGSIGSPLPDKIPGLRVLMVFQDPRPRETNFTVVAPSRAPGSLRGTDHRYFCLSEKAWADLGLTAIAPTPQWPTPETAHLFLKKYLRGGSWSYDGIIALFLYLFRPEDAYITNLAKCYFIDNQDDAVYDNCAQAHLSREFKLFEPNLVISFTSKLTSEKRRAKQFNPPHAFLRFSHPASHGGGMPRSSKFRSELTSNRENLARLSLDVDSILSKWESFASEYL